MKLLLLTLILVSCLGTDSKAIKDAEMTTDQAPKTETAASGSFVEENDMCICTKEYAPVCGSNGVTYPSACQAGCEDIKEFTDGECK